MPNPDITRYLNQPRKHYSGARLQQGRAILDSDFNEGAEARSDGWREALLDIAGASGTPDDGFLPALKAGDVLTAKLVRFGAFTQAFVLDYPIKAGVMFVGGSRWEQPESEPAIFQREFLQMGAATAPRAALGQQRQLSYFRGWEQPVTAVEDGELLEPALAGADSAVRIRRVRRVEVRTVQSSECQSAFAEVLEELGDGDTGTYDPATAELRSNARLQMTFRGAPDVECGPCTPSLEGRYLGGENHAIRIMLASPDHYVWAFDNAAPVYRVRLVLDGGGGARVDMLTPPKDTFHHPRQNTVVEFLPWEALLDNGKPQGGKIFGETVHNEKIATRVGVFGEADEPYQAASRSFHVRLASGSALAMGIGKGKTESKAESLALMNLKSGQEPSADGIALRWDEQHPFDDQLNPSESSTEGFIAYMYMRVWHLKQPDAQLTIPTSSGEALGATGLIPVFTGRGRPGDFWTIAVRPNAPDEILPLEIMREGGSRPHGPREVVAPVSLVTWSSLTGFTHEVVAIEDCRPGIRALTERGCCTHEVGPGAEFSSIQAAVNALPLSGGRICVRPGIYREQIRITNRSNVKLTGCGGRSRIESPEGSQDSELVSVEASSNVSIRNFALEARGQIAIRSVDGTGLELRNLNIQQAAPHSAVQVTGTGRVRILRCRIETDGAFSNDAALYLDSPDGALVEGNTIETRRNQQNELSFYWGGIHVAGGSRDVEIRGNRIRGGRGHGITLGSVRFRALDGSEAGITGAGLGQSGPEPPFAVTGIIQPIAIQDRQFFPEPETGIDDVVIAGNHIEGTGSSGISSLGLEVQRDDRTIGPPLCFRRTTFAISNLIVEDNQILNNGRQPAPNTGMFSAFGGVVLSDATRATVRGNLIEGNGANLPAPVSGICVARGEDVAIVSNRVRGNGAMPPGTAPPSDGPVIELPGMGQGSLGPRFRGGIVMGAPGTQRNTLNDEGPRNIHVRQNVVDQPDALSMFIVSRGACRINSNYLHSHGRDGRLPVPAVLVFAFGQPWEAVDLPAGEPNPDRWQQPQGSREYLNGRAQQLPAGDGGALSFHSNQVTTNGAAAFQAGGFGAWLLSTDHVSVVGNQFAARGSGRLPTPHVMAIGATLDGGINRVAETLEATQVSLAAMAAMLTACGGNHLTHCPAVFGCANHNNPDYFIEEDNLVWFRPQGGRCEQVTQPVMVVLRQFCSIFFGRTPGLTPGNLTGIRNVQP